LYRQQPVSFRRDFVESAPKHAQLIAHPYERDAGLPTAIGFDYRKSAGLRFKHDISRLAAGTSAEDGRKRLDDPSKKCYIKI
jgi:hypothetical protein